MKNVMFFFSTGMIFPASVTSICPNPRREIKAKRKKKAIFRKSIP
jgi:hypothetical protein